MNVINMQRKRANPISQAVKWKQPRQRTPIDTNPPKFICSPRQCLAAAELLGTFVAPEVFLNLLLDHVKAPSSASHPWCALMVLQAVLGGCPRAALAPHLPRIAGTLAQPDVCQEYQQVPTQICFSASESLNEA